MRASRTARPSTTAFANLSIRVKLLLAFGAVLLVVAGLGAISLLRIGEVNTAGASVRGNWLPGVQRAAEMAQAASALRHAEAGLVMSPDADTMKDTAKAIALARGQFMRARTALAALPTTVMEQTFVAELDQAWLAYLDIDQKIVAAVADKKIDEASDLATGDAAYRFGKVTIAVLRIGEEKAKGGDAAVAHAEATYQNTLPIMAGSVGLAALVCLIAAAIMIASVARPIVAMTGAMRKLAAGDTGVDIPARDRRDEIGGMAQAVQVFKENMAETARLRMEQDQAQRSQIARGLAVAASVTAFEKVIAGAIDETMTAANGFETTARAMESCSAETARQSSVVTAASEQTTRNVQMVAAAAEELSVSIREIGEQIDNAAGLIEQSVKQTSHSNSQVKGLADIAEEIGGVVRMISDIAGQTNLLALNATIEAARAGDAGKGFAVVASEVKVLATQTAHATEQISSQIRTIQEATRAALQSIESVTETIGKVDRTAAAIAVAVAQQSAATSEISRNVLQAAQGTEEVSSNVSRVTSAAGETGSAAAQLLISASALSRNGQTLRSKVESFLQEVKVA